MLGAFQFGIFTILWLPFAAAALYGLGLASYRLFFSPLAKFPGPKLAALTRKYELYYEAVQNYEYLWKIKKLHQQYGRCINVTRRVFSIVRLRHAAHLRSYHSHQPSRNPH